MIKKSAKPPALKEIRKELKTLLGNAIPAPSGSSRIGVPDPDEVIEVVLHMRYKPSSKALPSLEELAAIHPRKRKRLSHEEFETQYGAADDDVDKIKTFAAEHQLEIVKVNPAHRTVTISGTVKEWNAVFGVELAHFKHPHRLFRCHEGHVHIPMELAEIVTGVFGLDTTPAAEPEIRLPGPKKKAAAADVPDSPDATEEEGKFYPNELARLYHFPQDVNGAGQSIAIVEMGGGYDPEHLRHYFEEVLKMPMPKITDVSVAGGENNPYTGELDAEDQQAMAAYSATAETYLDIEVAGAVAPGAELVIYFAPNTGRGFLESVKQAVHDKEHKNNVVSISWSKGENTWQSAESLTNAFNQVLQEAAAMGITVLAASGDRGSSNTSGEGDGLAHVVYPASSPYVMACGGTHLVVEDGVVKAETAWKQEINQVAVGDEVIDVNTTAASGGGVSVMFEPPSYQTDAGIHEKSVNPGGKTGRGVPDVAGNADRRSGYIIQVNDDMIPGCGTSAVAPLYGALIAQINQKLDASVGFLNPFLYQHSKEKGLFHDITVGDNITGDAGGYTAEKGWDAVTGWGSIHGENLLKLLQKD